MVNNVHCNIYVEIKIVERHRLEKPTPTKYLYNSFSNEWKWMSRNCKE